MKRRFLFFLCLLCFLFPASISWGAQAPAKEQETEVTQGLDLDQYDLTDIQKFLDQRNDNQGLNLSFQDLMKSLMDGKLNDVLSQTGKALKNADGRNRKQRAYDGPDSCTWHYRGCLF